MRKALILLVLTSFIAGCELQTINPLPVFEDNLEISLASLFVSLGYTPAASYTLQSVDYQFNRGSSHEGPLQSLTPGSESIEIPLDGNVCYGSNKLDITPRFMGPDGEVGFPKSFTFDVEPVDPNLIINYDGITITDQVVVPAGQEIAFEVSSSSSVVYACEATLQLIVEGDVQPSEVVASVSALVPGSVSASFSTPDQEASYNAMLVLLLGNLRLEQPFTLLVEAPNSGFVDIDLIGPDTAPIVIQNGALDVVFDAEVSDGQRIELEAGLYLVQAQDVAGFISPDEKPLTVRRAESTSLTLNYQPEQQPGTLEVTLQGVPQATVTVFDVQDGVVFNDEVVAAQSISLPPGSYRVEAQAVADKVTPEPVDVEITENTTTPVVLTYIEFQGTLEIVLAGVTAAPITIRNANDAVIFNETISTSVSLSLDPDTYTVTPGEIEGFETPAPRIASVASGATASLTLTYQPIVNDSGTLDLSVTGVDAAPIVIVNAQSEEVFNGVVTGSASITLAEGSYTVQPQAVPDFITPSEVGIIITMDETTPLTVNYTSTTANSGILRVLLEGVASAKINVLTLNNAFVGSFDVVNGTEIAFDPGSYKIVPVQQSGTTTPAEQTVTIVLNEVTTVTLNYAGVSEGGVNFLSPVMDSEVTSPVLTITAEIENPGNYQGLAFRWLRENATIKIWRFDYDPGQSIYTFEARGLDPALFNGTRTIIAETFDGSNWTERGRTTFLLNMPSASRGIEFRNFPDTINFNPNNTSTQVFGGIFSKNGFTGDVTMSVSASAGISAVLAPTFVNLSSGELAELELIVSANDVSPGSYAVVLSAVDEFNDKSAQLTIPVNYAGDEGRLIINLEGVSSANVVVTQVSTGATVFSDANAANATIVDELEPGDYQVATQSQVCWAAPAPVTVSVPAFGSASALLVFTEDSSSLAPSLSWVSPSEGANITTRPVPLQVSVSGDCVDSVEYFLDQVSLGTEFTAPYDAEWTPSVADNGTGLVLRATITDKINRSASSQISVNLNISASPLEVTATYDLNSNNATVPVAANGDVFIGAGRAVQRFSQSGASDLVNTDGIVREVRSVNNAIYAMDDQGFAYRIDTAAALTAVKLWRAENIGGGLLADGGGKVFAASEVELNAVANATWASTFLSPNSFRIEDIAASADGAFVYVAAFKTIYALDGDTGALVASAPVPDGASVERMIYAFGKVWVTASNRGIYRFDKDFAVDPNPLLIEEACGVSTLMRFSGSHIWITGENGCLFRIDSAGNATFVEAPSAPNGLESAFSSGTLVYTTSAVGSVYVFNNDSTLSFVAETMPAGTVRPTGGIFVINGKVYVPYANRRLYVLEAF